jgi:hypothetical protein
MTRADTTADHKGELRPSNNETEQLEDKIADEKNVQIGDESVSHELKRDS